MHGVGGPAASRAMGSAALTRVLRRLALVAAPALLTIVAPVQLHGACAADQVQIAVVVDFGTGRSVSAACVGAGTRDSGAAVLAARASQLGTAPPRTNASGLVCAIDGYPSEGCGEQTGGHYAYWSYWHGDASGWTYSNVGPAGSRAQPGTVEGWRFQPAGAGNPSDPPPRGSPDAATTCRPAAPPATSVPTVRPASRPAARTGGTGGASTTAIPTSAAGGPTSTDVAPGTTAAAGSSTETAVAAGPLANGAPTPVAARRGTGGHGSSPWGLVGGVGLVGAVGGAGALVARRRARPSP